MSAALIEHLARVRGIGDAYHDFRGELRHFSLATKTALLRAMHVDVEDMNAVQAAIREGESARWTRIVPPVIALRASARVLPFVAPAEADWITLTYAITLEGGGVRSGEGRIGSLHELERRRQDNAELVRREIALPADLPFGYHTIEVRIGDRPPVRSMLISAPDMCYQPASVAHGGRVWGIVAQLYTLRSANNWGYGDFGDLLTLVRAAAKHGAGFVGLNPLHALFPSDPVQCSPYSASSRLALNVLYIAAPLVPEFAECEAARVLVASAEFRRRIAAARATHHVDYAAAAALKFEVLELLFAHFRAAHLARNSARAKAFRAFAVRGGSALRLHATFDAIDTHLRRTTGTHAGWQNWPAEYRRPDSAAVRLFEERYAERIEFYSYLQWLAAEQLASVQSLARDLGMSTGLYCDYAVGVSSSGSETWSDQVVYCMGAAIGAPPDALALLGQDWGIPPQDPAALERARYEPFVRLIRSNLQGCGALRIDHVMALFRQWWVPRGLGSTAGGYVHYPVDTLLAIVALESMRAEALIVGEDLGTVPNEMRQAMQAFAVYHYKVMFFEKDGEEFRAPARYEPRSLATITTHDLPTLRAWWQGDDIALRERLKLYPSAEAATRVREERQTDLARLLAALERAGLWQAAAGGQSPPYSDALARAVHAYLGSSAARLVAVQLEDLVGMIEPINVPGTSTEFPNWQRKMSEEIEQIFARASVPELLAAVTNARRSAT
jgi:4-alpha-glucanotransferase